jgi:hypothetical protein
MAIEVSFFGEWWYTVEKCGAKEIGYRSHNKMAYL